MRPRHHVSALLAASLAIGAVAMAPALSTDETSAGAVVLEGAGGDEDICDGFEDASFCAGPSDQGGTPPDDGTEAELYEPCAAAEGVTAITPAAGFDEEITTPVGALTGGSEFGVGEVTELGYFQLDLAGYEVGTPGRLTMTLSWDTPAGLSDYDLIIDGSNEYSAASPETHTRTLGHCGRVDLAADVFTGTPLDTVTLQVTAKDL